MATKLPAGTVTSMSMSVAGAARSHVNSPVMTTPGSPAARRKQQLIDDCLVCLEGLQPSAVGGESDTASSQEASPVITMLDSPASGRPCSAPTNSSGMRLLTDTSHRSVLWFIGAARAWDLQMTRPDC